jgi:CBS-domain-containing membrane protein
MVPQIPYSAIGIGIAVIFGVWAFIVAETVKERAVIAGIPAVIFLVGALFRSPVGQLISLIGWVIYGVGCIIYLRFNGMEIR